MYKLEYINDYPDQIEYKISVQIPSDISTADILEIFAQFLRACGFPLENNQYLEVESDGYPDAPPVP